MWSRWHCQYGLRCVYVFVSLCSGHHLYFCISIINALCFPLPPPQENILKELRVFKKLCSAIWIILIYVNGSFWESWLMIKIVLNKTLQVQLTALHSHWLLLPGITRHLLINPLKLSANMMQAGIYSQRTIMLGSTIFCRSHCVKTSVNHLWSSLSQQVWAWSS